MARFELADSDISTISAESVITVCTLSKCYQPPLATQPHAKPISYARLRVPIRNERPLRREMKPIRTGIVVGSNANTSLSTPVKSILLVEITPAIVEAIKENPLERSKPYLSIVY